MEITIKLDGTFCEFKFCTELGRTKSSVDSKQNLHRDLGFFSIITMEASSSDSLT